MPTQEKVTCRKCQLTFTSSPTFDFYPDGGDRTTGLCENCMMGEAFAGPSKKEPVAIPEGYRDTVCKMGQGGATCSFLMFGGSQFECAKGSPFESNIRQRLKEGSIRAVGDNCSGPPDFTPTKAS